MTKFAALFDIHWGFERRSGHKVPLHDEAALEAAFAFLEDFKPDTVILGGDTLDCGVISHHNKGKPGRTEGLRLLADAEGCKREVIARLDALKPKSKRAIIGNHEAWLEDLIESEPGIEGLMEFEHLLDLKGWEVIPQGGYTNLGKLTFIHGDQLAGGEHVAKQAVITWERCIRFGHFHTFQVHSKSTPLHEKLGRTGVAVPCLSRRDPAYGRGAANRWMQGLNWGYIFPDGTFADYVSIITNGRLVANGKVYKG